MVKRGLFHSFICGLVLLGMLLSFAACGRSDDTGVDGDTQDGDDSVQTAVGQEGTLPKFTGDGVFTMRYVAGESLNPFTCENAYNAAVLSLVYQTIFRVDENFRYESVLCSEIETEDNIVYYLTVEPVKMHDGSTLTADDVAYSINCGRTTGIYISRLANIASCLVVEDRVQITLLSADATLPYDLDIPVIKYGTLDSEKPVGTGPYVLNGTVLEAFSGYGKELPLDKIVLTELEDREVPEAFATGAVDMIIDDTGDDLDYNFHSDYEARYYGTTWLQYVGLNSRSPYLSDSVRKAIYSAVDRQGIVDSAYGGCGQPASLILNPDHYAYPEAAEIGAGYSTSRVESYIEEAKLKDSDGDGFLEYETEEGYVPFVLRFIVCTDSGKKVHAAQIIADSLIDMGFNVELTKLDRNSYLLALQEGEFDLYYGEVALAKDFDFSVLLGSGGAFDYGKMGSDTYDELIESFLNAESDNSKREAASVLCAQVKSLASVVPVLYRQYAVYTQRGAIEGFKPTVSGALSDIENWTVYVK